MQTIYYWGNSMLYQYQNIIGRDILTDISIASTKKSTNERHPLVAFVDNSIDDKNRYVCRKILIK